MSGVGSWGVRGALAACVVALSAAPARSQVAAPDGRSAEQLQRVDRLGELERLRRDTRLRVNQDVPPGQRLLADYGAYLTFNYISVDDETGDNHVLREYEFLPYLRLNFDGAQELFVRGRIGYRDFNDGDSFDGRGDEPIDGDLDRGYYRFDLAAYRGAYDGVSDGRRLVVQVGRDFVYWGNGLVLGQVLDGATVSLGDDRFTLDLVAGLTPTRTVDIDSSRPEFDHNTKRAFYGAMLAADLDAGRFGDHRPYVYGLIQRDHNDDDFRQISFIETNYQYDSYYLGVGSGGSLGQNVRYGVEAAYEFGETKSNSFSLDGFGISPVEQTDDRIRAGALDARLDYFVKDARQTRVGLELILATGDGDRGHTTNTFNGNLGGTNDASFNAFGLLNTGLAFAPDVSNLIAVRAGVATFPFADVARLRRLQVGVDFFAFAKLLRHGPIDEATSDRRFLGVEPDVYLNWQLTSDVTLALRYGVFFPDDDTLASDEPRHLFYGGVTFAF